MAHHPGLGSFSSWCDMAKARVDFSIAHLWPHMPRRKWKQQGRALRREQRGCVSAPSRRDPAGSVGDTATALLPLLRARRGSSLLPADTLGRALTAGTGSPGNKLSRLLQGIFQFRADAKGFYVSNLHYMSLLSPITCQSGEAISGSGSSALTLGRVSGEAAAAGKCTVLSPPYL